MLTAEKARELWDYDPETGRLTWRADIRAGSHRQILLAKAGDEAGTLLAKGYRLVRHKRRQYLAHRVIFLIVLGRWPVKHVDHVNGARDDNRWINLREATPLENNRNRRARVDSATKVKGVSKVAGSDKWRARINRGGVDKSLGRFGSVEEAAAAYESAAKQTDGAFFKEVRHGR